VPILLSKNSARKSSREPARFRLTVHPNVRIIPIALGIFSYGSLLGVFLCGIFTERRGNDLGNIIAMIVGFIVVAILSDLPNNISGLQPSLR
jgi:Na+/proline symporter